MARLRGLLRANVRVPTRRSNSGRFACICARQSDGRRKHSCIATAPKSAVSRPGYRQPPARMLAAYEQPRGGRDPVCTSRAHFHMGAAMKGSRARRLLEGWGANLTQLLLGITQQVGLVPVLLHFTSGV